MRHHLVLFSTMLVLVSSLRAQADLVSFVTVPGYPTGAYANAIAGPLFSSAIHAKDIPGPGADFVTVTKFGNIATHDYSVKLDYSATPAFFDSMYMGAFGRTAVLDHRASAESIFHFIVDVPTFFSVSGFFGAIDSMGTTIPGNIELELELLEFDTFAPMGPPPTTKFYSYQVSHDTIGETFVAGGMGGDFINSLIGAPTGLLMPGKFYKYRTLVTINAIDPDGAGPMLPTNGAATASGAHVIMFSSAIPESSSVSLLLLAGICLVTGRVGNRKRLA